MGKCPMTGKTSASSRFIKVSACLGDLPIDHHAHHFRATFSKLLSSSRFGVLLLRLGLCFAFGHRIGTGSE
jgi:hypothetical protein